MAFVKDWMKKKLISTTMEETIENVAKAMRDYDITGLVVVDDDMQPIGMITSRDLVIEVMAQGRSPQKTQVAHVMTSGRLITAREYSTMEEAARLMVEHNMKRLPVINEFGRLVGIISQSDMNRYIAQQ